MHAQESPLLGVDVLRLVDDHDAKRRAAHEIRPVHQLAALELSSKRRQTFRASLLERGRHVKAFK